MGFAEPDQAGPEFLQLARHGAGRRADTRGGQHLEVGVGDQHGDAAAGGVRELGDLFRPGAVGFHARGQDDRFAGVGFDQP